jgi:hypothetical protein
LDFHNKVLILPLIVKNKTQKLRGTHHEEVNDLDIDGCDGDSPAGTARHADRVFGKDG